MRRWFDLPDVDARPLALLRIALGTLVLIDLGDRLRDFHAFYTAAGLVPDGGGVQHWSLLALSNDPAVTLALYLLAFPAAVLALLGLFTRAALVATLCALVSLHHRNPYVEGGGDAVLRALVLWMIFVDAGACLSLDVALGRRTARGSISAWPVLVLQLQIALVYLFAFLGKTGPSWRDGSAIVTALTTSDWARGAGPWLATHPLLCRGLSHATLWFEAGFAPLVFWPGRHKPARALALGAGLALHAGIFFSMRVGNFSEVMAASYLAFVPGAWLDRFVPRPAAAGAGPTPPTHTQTLALAVAFALIVAGQITALAPGGPPRALAVVLETGGQRQDWRVFAPDAPHLDVTFTAPGVLTDGRAIELIAPSQVLAGLGPQRGFRYSRWHRVRNMLVQGAPDLIEAVGRFACRRLAETPPAAGLDHFELHRHIQDMSAHSARAEVQDAVSLRQSCVGGRGGISPDQ